MMLTTPTASAIARRRALNAWIAVLLALLTIDAFPAGIEGVRRIKSLFNPVLKASGLWQGSWALFAPNPDRINTWIEAEVKLSDGTRRIWSTPDWQALRWSARPFFARQIKLANNLRLDRNSRAWPAFAAYAARNVGLTANDPRAVHVTLTRRWWNVPPPGRRAQELVRYGRLPPPRSAYERRFLFYQRDLP